MKITNIKIRNFGAFKRLKLFDLESNYIAELDKIDSLFESIVDKRLEDNYEIRLFLKKGKDRFKDFLGGCLSRPSKKFSTRHLLDFISLIGGDPDYDRENLAQNPDFKSINELKELVFILGKKNHCTNSVTLIKGPSGSGKSSFMNAIKWCLTGTRNDYVRESLKDEANVELTVSHGTDVYKIKRTSIKKKVNIKKNESRSEPASLRNRPDMVKTGSYYRKLDLKWFTKEFAISQNGLTIKYFDEQANLLGYVKDPELFIADKLCMPEEIIDFMFVDGDTLESQVFMNKDSKAERNERLFDALFKDPIKRKLHEDTLNNYFNDGIYPKIKVNYKDRSIDPLQNLHTESIYSMGMGDRIYYQILLYHGIHSILRKEKEFPLFFENITDCLDDIKLSALQRIFGDFEAHIFFITSQSGIPYLRIDKYADNIFNLRKK